MEDTIICFRDFLPLYTVHFKAKIGEHFSHFYVSQFFSASLSIHIKSTTALMQVQDSFECFQYLGHITLAHYTPSMYCQNPTQYSNCNSTSWNKCQKWLLFRCQLFCLVAKLLSLVHFLHLSPITTHLELHLAPTEIRMQYRAFKSVTIGRL